FGRPAADVKRVDRIAHELDRGSCHKPAQWDSQESTSAADDCGFREECHENLTLACTQRTGDTNFGATPDNRHGNCVEDEKGANNQRDVAKQAQIPSECSKHPAIFFSGCSGGTQLHALGQHLPYTIFPFGKSAGIRSWQANENAINAPAATEYGLSCGDVHDQS